ncbi:MAG: immune inhibitor A [Anaerolineae bacterium]
MRTFWVVDPAIEGRREISARLRVQTDHAAMWVEQGKWHDVRQLEQAARLFETKIYPVIRTAFGSEWTPGIDNDPRIHILHATGLGERVLGYTSSMDEYRSDVYPLSNQAEMIAVNLDRVGVGSPTYQAMLARQFQRLVQWHQDRNEERWVKEGLAELAVELCGFEVERLEQAYLEQTDTSLTDWTNSESQRGAAYLFIAYFHERFGDTGIRALTSEPANGIAGINATLEKLDADLAFEDLFADWLATNILDGAPNTSGSRYAYSRLDLGQPTPAVVHEEYPVRVETSVHQLGADYIVLRGKEDIRIRFVGEPETPLLGTEPHSGQCAWWSNRGDESLTTLTHAFDLSDTTRATMTFWTWYDIEPHYDYAMVELSRDGGEHWDILSTPSGTGVDPHSNSPGWSYTGKSRGWIEEKIDLSEYAGEMVFVRFSYLTDEAVTGEGFLVDDISISEIDYRESVETGISEWIAEGFLITNARVPQSYLALLIGTGQPHTVERLPLEEDRTGEWTVALEGGDAREYILVVSAMAPLTAQPAPYQLRIGR